MDSSSKSGTKTKRPRKARARSTRGKKSTNGRFGIRYLHHHMFEEELASGNKNECPYVECKCGGAMAAVYSGKTVLVLTASILILLIGVTFMLVGYLIPRRPVVYLERGDGSRTAVDRSALTFNNMLDDFTLIGTVLISFGALLFCVLLLVPICRASNRKGEYYKAPTEETATGQAQLISAKTLSADSTVSGQGDREDAIRRFSSGAGKTSASSTIEKIPVLALVHNVQPQSQQQQEPVQSTSSSSSRTKEYRKRRAEKYKDSFEEESED